ncbi:MAG: HTTM domain-containing protein [Crocinitomicaceae bacterium]|nr:HTTM domain-containing protein [Crocinitomicaceae bacterium]
MKEKIADIFTREFRYMDKIEFFRRALYLLLLFNTLTLLPIAHDMFAYYGLTGHGAWNTNFPIWMQGSKGITTLLSHPATSDRNWVYVIVLIGQITFLITGLLRVLPILSSIAVYICTVNLFLKGGSAFTGGENLVNLVLFYLMFIQISKTKGWLAELQNILNNTFYWILLIQICVLYFFSGLFKLFDPYWMQGYAVMYVSKLEIFSSWMTVPFEKSYILSAIATYTVVLYQITFAIAVWIKKIKIPFLIYGVAFHLMIAFGMGIFNFGLIMVVMYLLFLDDQHIERIKSLFKRRRSVKTT